MKRTELYILYIEEQNKTKEISTSRGTLSLSTLDINVNKVKNIQFGVVDTMKKT